MYMYIIYVYILINDEVNDQIDTSVLRCTYMYNACNLILKECKTVWSSIIIIFYIII